MTTPSEQTPDPEVSVASQGSASGFSRFIDPATILAMVVSSGFYIGWQYTGGYFSRFGIESDWLDFSTTYYLTHSLLLVFLLWNLFSLSLHSDGVPRDRFDAYIANYFLIGVGALFAFGAWFDDTDGVSSYVSLGFGSAFALIFTYLSWRKFSALIYFKSRTLVEKFGLLFICIVLIGAIANQFGSIHARKTIEGDIYNTEQINIVWKERALDDVLNNELILIDFKDGKYYVTPKEKPAPKFPKVYVVPIDQTKYVSIVRIK